MIERRQYARLNTEVNIKYRIIGKKAKNSTAVECNNISPEGLCLTFQDALNVKTGTKLEVEIALKESKPFAMIGEVIWGRDLNAESGKTKGKMRVGIKILEIYNDDENRFLLQMCDRMVQKLSKDYPTTKS